MPTSPRSRDHRHGSAAVIGRRNRFPGWQWPRAPTVGRISRPSRRPTNELITSCGRSDAGGVQRRRARLDDGEHPGRTPLGDGGRAAAGGAVLPALLALVGQDQQGRLHEARDQRQDQRAADDDDGQRLLRLASRCRARAPPAGGPASRRRSSSAPGAASARPPRARPPRRPCAFVPQALRVGHHESASWMATPKIEMKPIAAEIEKFVRVTSSARTPPVQAHRDAAAARSACPSSSSPTSRPGTRSAAA